MILHVGKSAGEKYSEGWGWRYLEINAENKKNLL